MPSALDWHHKVRDVLDGKIERRDVWLALHVDANSDLPLDALDDDEFAEWAEDWVDFTVSSSAGPIMPGTSETEWSVGANDDVVVKLRLVKRSRRDGPLVGNPEPDGHTWLGD